MVLPSLNNHSDVLSVSSRVRTEVCLSPGPKLGCFPYDLPLTYGPCLRDAFPWLKASDTAWPTELTRELVSPHAESLNPLSFCDAESNLKGKVHLCEPVLQNLIKCYHNFCYKPNLNFISLESPQVLNLKTATDLVQGETEIAAGLSSILFRNGFHTREGCRPWTQGPYLPRGREGRFVLAELNICQTQGWCSSWDPIVPCINNWGCDRLVS